MQGHDNNCPFAKAFLYNASYLFYNNILCLSRLSVVFLQMINCPKERYYGQFAGHGRKINKSKRKFRRKFSVLTKRQKISLIFYQTIEEMKKM